LQPAHVTGKPAIRHFEKSIESANNELNSSKPAPVGRLYQDLMEVKMRRKVIIITAVLLGAFIAADLQATEKPSAALGEKLFNDPALGGSGNARSCSSCHPGGKGLEDAGSNPDLAAIINRCISGPLGGQTIGEDSTQMQSIILYIQSLKGKD
jgi:cytochrome c553